MSVLPDSWTALSLGEVVPYGQTEKAEPSSIDANEWVLELEDIEKETSRVINRQTFAQRQSKSTKNRFKEGDVLYGKLRPYLNKVVLADSDGVCTTEIVPIRSNEAVHSSYLFYWLKHPEFLAYVNDVSHGVNMPRLGTEAGKAAPFVLAPLPEQRRIADKLDATLARVDACRDRLARITPLVKRFRQSVLAAATSGRLTEDWRAENRDAGIGNDVIRQDAVSKADLLLRNPSLSKKKSTTHSQIDSGYLFEIPETWGFTSWGALSEWITYGFTRPMPAASAGVRLLTAKDVHPFDIRIADSGWTDESSYINLSDKDRPACGDLLITKDGSIGRAAIVRSEEPFCINQSVAVCWLRSTSMSKQYLEMVANTEFTQRFVFDKAKGMAIQHLSIVDFACCPIPVPPAAEQHEIVRRVETLFAFADRLEARLATAQTAADRLTPALLAKAFRGELVPQDPKDEPASALLQRLAAQRASEPKPKRGRKAAS